MDEVKKMDNKEEFAPISKETLKNLMNMNSNLIARGEYIFREIKDYACFGPYASAYSIEIDEDSIDIDYEEDPYYGLPTNRNFVIPIDVVATFESMTNFINDFKKKFDVEKERELKEQKREEAQKDEAEYERLKKKLNK